MCEAIHSPFIRKYKNYFWLHVALFVAFALRVAFLDAQSLWDDEGTSIALARGLASGEHRVTMTVTRGMVSVNGVVVK